MDTTQGQEEDKKNAIRKLLDKLTWQRDAEALYEAFIEAIEEIPDRAIKTEVCMNTVRYMATQNAVARITPKGGDDELAGIFEEECNRLGADMLAMPGQFREWLKKTADRKRDFTPGKRASVDAAVTIVDLLAVLGGPACDCERCTAFRAFVGPEPSETPTEVPPPPDPTN